MTPPDGLDWRGLQQAGLHGLGLHPDQFWSLTPAELAMMLGVAGGSAGMSRKRLSELVQRYPDRDRLGPAQSET